MRLLSTTTLAGLLAVAALPTAAVFAHTDTPAPPLPAPKPMSVKASLKKDSMSGWNLHVVTSGFRWTPADAGKKSRPGTGHAHLYLDGTKIGRLYGSWFHLNNVPPGRHTLTVELNGNDHRAWVSKGKKVAHSVKFTEPTPEPMTMPGTTPAPAMSGH